MTVHDLRITRIANEVAAPSKQPHHPLGEFDTQSLAKRIVIFTPGGDQIESLVSLARRSIIGLTTTAEVACRVMSHNPDTVWAITRRNKYNPANPTIEGFFALLMLNDAGMRRLVDGSFDATDPD